MSNEKEVAHINNQNTPDDMVGGGIGDNLAKAFQQSVDILSSLVDNLVTAGIVDLSDHSYTVLKDRTGKTMMNARHPYSEFFYTWMKPFLLEESEEGLRLADFSYLEEKLRGTQRVSQDYHIKGGMWLRCTWTPFRGHRCEDSRILLYSANVTEEYKGNERLAAQLQEREAIIQGLGEVYYSVLLVDYQRNHVSVYRHEDEDGRDIAEYFAKADFCWSEGLAQYCRDLPSEDTGEGLRKALSVESLQKAEAGFSVNYQKKIGGTLRYLEARVSFVKKHNGSRVAVVGTRSVDDTVRYEKELRTRLQMIAAAAGTVYPLVAEVNLSRNTYQIISYSSFVNKTAAIEGSLDDFIAAGVSTLPDKEEAEAFERLFCRQNQIDAFLRGEKELQLRHRQLGDDGLVHWMDTRVIFMAGEDGDMHEISLSRCIDEDIRLSKDLAEAKDAAEAANRAKSTFLFNMSHDIRTPMNAIMGFTELALQYIGNSEKQEDYLKKIKASSEYMLNLLNSVLEMARIEKGKLTLDLEPAELKEVLQNGLSLFEDEANCRNLQYGYSLAFDEITANFDRIRVEEILSNVVSNAIKYTGAGGRVDVSATLAEQQEGRYELTMVVQDTGIGMSKDFLPNIFDSFERERNEMTREIQGTGLGMGITKKLLEIMDGTIQIESELGVGTTVTVKLPFERVVSKGSLKENAHPEDFADLLRGKRLLLAEDNDLNAEIAIELLGKAGLFVERAADGVECVSMLCKAAPHYYDAILMDIQMPKLDGYMATEKIRRLNDSEKSGIPIIAMTANAFEEDRKKALAKGMDGFVSKPVEMNKLFETLLGVMKSYRQS
ncbi:MAG: ATP-binding protein [Anaerotignum sp.]